FVIFGMAARQGILPAETADLMTVVVSLSMGLTPLLYGVLVKVVRPRLVRKVETRPFDEMRDDHSPVIIAGFGRIGQVVARILRAKRIPFTALDSNPDHIEFMKRWGNVIFYGDAARLDLLRSAGAKTARIFV